MHRRTLPVSLIAIVAASTLAFGCIQQSDHPIGSALPTAESVRVKVPEGTAARQVGDSGSAIGATGLAVLGETAELYAVTRNVTRDLNGGIAWVLILVHAIVQFPPTSVDGNVYTWGPGSDPLDPADYRLVVTDNADGSYDWTLDGRSKITPEDGFLSVISGHAIPGDEPHRGSGTFTIDFDAGERVNPIENDAHGQVSVAYDLENRDDTQATLDVTIDSTETGDDGVERPVHFDYFYGENQDRSGDFLFAITADLDDEGGAAENASIRSRWAVSGEGRSDVQATGGDLGELTVTVTECWDVRFARVFYADSENWAPIEGDESACVFESLVPGA